VSVLDLQVLGPAFVAGLLVLATHVPLGTLVLDRGIIFIDIALAQVAATGVVFGGMMWGGGVTGWIVQASAVGAAIGCSFVLAWTDKRVPAMQEAIIGVLYVTASAVQIMMLSVSPTGSEHLKQILVGQILWVTPLQLAGIALVYAGVLALWYFRDLSRDRGLFYVAFAIVITISVQVVGILLVFSSLVVPALAARAGPRRWRILVALNIGVAGYLLGLVASAALNLPTGAAIVCALVVVALAAGFVLARASAPQRQAVVPHAGAAE
jgi:zinc/manganese transport system permease protein